jgi:hypothetical protein
MTPQKPRDVPSRSVLLKVAPSRVGGLAETATAVRLEAAIGAIPEPWTGAPPKCARRWQLEPGSKGAGLGRPKRSTDSAARVGSSEGRRSASLTLALN